jgi:hypothetical protein
MRVDVKINEDSMYVDEVDGEGEMTRGSSALMPTHVFLTKTLRDICDGQRDGQVLAILRTRVLTISEDVSVTGQAVVALLRSCLALILVSKRPREARGRQL